MRHAETTGFGRPSSRWTGRMWGWLVFFVALALRVGWVTYRALYVGPELEFPDEQVHWQLATSLVTHGELVSGDGRRAARMPAYPIFLAGFAWMGGGGVPAARLAQAVIGATTALLAYRLARAALGAKAGLGAGALACFDPYAIFFANLLLTEVPFTLLALALTVCAWHAATDGGRALSGWAVGVAVLGALAVLTRPAAIGWVLLLWMVLLLPDHDRRRRGVRLLLSAVTLAVLLLPWGLRNRAVLGSFAWLSTNGGVTLYDGQGPQADGSSNQSFLQRMPELTGLSEVARDEKLRQLALQQMRQDPARVLRLAAVKFARTWSLRPNFEGYRQSLAGLVGAGFTALVLMLAAVGVWRSLSPASAAGRTAAPARGAATTRRLQVLLWLPVVYFTLIHCVYVGSLRYRVPLMPFVGIAAAAALLRRADTPMHVDASPVRSA